MSDCVLIRYLQLEKCTKSTYIVLDEIVYSQFMDLEKECDIVFKKPMSNLFNYNGVVGGC